MNLASLALTAALLASLVCNTAAAQPRTPVWVDPPPRVVDPAPRVVDPPPRVAPSHRWDARHGHGRAYPVAGHTVRHLPPGAIRPIGVPVLRGAHAYHFHDGIWYVPGRGGYVVARPPVGLIVPALPVFRTIVRAGSAVFYYSNDVYYRAVSNGYEVVHAPTDVASAPATTSSNQAYVYPRLGQNSQQQANDEYLCHRWAVDQTGFDPVQGTSSRNDQRPDYERARSACLDGRGYTVR